jgi:hypothetical protein
MAAFLLALAGFAVLLVAITGISAGVVVSLSPRTRKNGVFFTLLWVPLFVVSLGLIWRDSPTFAVGAVCFAVAAATVAVRQRSHPISILPRRRSSGKARRRESQRRG